MDPFATSKLLWTPPAPKRTKVEALRLFVNRTRGLDFKDYHELYQYSVSDYRFWGDIWKFLGIIYSNPPTQVVADGYIKEVPLWFPGARLNYAENVLWRNDDAIAITESGEFGRVVSISYRDLREKVRVMANSLRVQGLQVGDRVAAIVANNINAVVLALATASLGGIFSSTATDMGVQGVLERYRQIQPKFIFSETEVSYAGKDINLVPNVLEIVKDLTSRGLARVILLPSVKTGKEAAPSVLNSITNSFSLAQFLASGDGRPLTFEQLPFEHPLYILYSSGTTGAPKCIVHSAGGALMATKKDVAIGLDLNMDETYFQYTSTAWMMWPFMLSGLACGARIITYDGSPFYPDVKGFLKFISDQHITVLGTSPRFLSEVQGRGINPLAIGDFSGLRAIMSTGAVLTPPMFEWSYKAFGGAAIASSSGGTDICACFVTAVPSLPIYSGEIQGKSLGLKVEIFDPSGRNIEDSGAPGELVCTRPHPSIPVKFWGDDAKGTKFLKAYFDVYPGVWRHGDFIARNPKTKGLIIYGRSDGVLNPSGVRFGSAEIYTVLERFADVIDDSICVGQRRPQDTDERVLLFLVMRAGHSLDAALDQRIRDAIRSALSRRHVPSYIFQVDAIPYTVNGKKIEIAVKQIVSGMDVKPSGAVANPEVLKHYYKYREIENFALVKAKL
ncbi:acetoacetate-CoA ligase [Auriscalpium vulgare]|uniref:Acetoacetate-CoA ligase n=1 Tax=Auriscalpium vulgare TaxID=40419 RepID=A0ACB8RM00_9AGAM|nr:acetoacetate-CoA ligase [Auriscalpium vulgare]